MFQGAIYLRFTFGVCRFYTGLTRMIRLNLGEIKWGILYNSYHIILTTIYYNIPPPPFLTQIESDSYGLTVLSLWPGTIDFILNKAKMKPILGRLIK